MEGVRDLLRNRAAAVNLSLSTALEDKLEAYFELLVRWNATINLTSLQIDPPAGTAIDRLLIEPVRAAALVDPNISIWFDLGSGGGSPAIPLQLAKPAKRLIMVESRDRKAAFLREVIRSLPVSGAEVQVLRIEQVTEEPHNAGLADLVTARAVRMDASLLGRIQTLLRFRGQAILFGAQVRSRDLPRGLERTDSPSDLTDAVVLRRSGL